MRNVRIWLYVVALVLFVLAASAPHGNYAHDLEAAKHGRPHGYHG